MRTSVAGYERHALVSHCSDHGRGGRSAKRRFHTHLFSVVEEGVETRSAKNADRSVSHEGRRYRRRQLMALMASAEGDVTRIRELTSEARLVSEAP